MTGIWGLVALATLAILVWYWFDTVQTLHAARHQAARLCQGADVQLLDDTVALKATRVRRVNGRLTLARQFHFEFSENGQERLDGQLLMTARHLDRAVLNGQRIGRLIEERS